ncbi:MAG: amidohydrolase family protein [Clostridiales bacterium]|nr:amidohydrolase family protein [Clostridiales bacterium]
MKAIKARWIICSGQEVRKNSVLLYEGDRISEILSAEEYERTRGAAVRAEELTDAGDCILMPGFVNAHMHQYGILSHGIPQAGNVVDFDTFLKNYWWPFIEDRITKREVLITSAYTMTEMLHSGITSFCDILEAPNTREDALIEQGKQIDEAGMRAIVSLEASERISTENGRQCLWADARAADYLKRYSDKVKGAISTHTTFTCSDAFIKEAAALAHRTDSMFQFHLSESAYEPERCRAERGILPVQVYEKNHALGPKTIATQCVRLSAREIALLRETGTQTVHMPISNCEVGGGIAGIPEMLEAGCHTALGTDGYVNDWFQVMRSAFLIHKAAKETTKVMPAAKVFQMATEYGAEAMGLETCGRLAPGYQADFVLCQMKQPTPVTEENIFDQIVAYGDRDQVTDVFIAGKPIMQAGEIVTLDEERLRVEMKACAEVFWAQIR